MSRRLGLGGALAALLLLGAPLSTRADDFDDFEREMTRLDRQERRAAKRAKRAARKKAMKPKREARAFRKLRVADDLKLRVEKLTTELTWHSTLEAAQAAGKQQQKPILWIQALGDLSGLL